VRISHITMQTRHRSRRPLACEAGRSGQRLFDALTDLNAYALTLDIECHRIEDRALELADVDSSGSEILGLLRERRELAEELIALRGVISALEHTLLH